MKKDILKRGVESQFQSNNNEAEYEIVLTSLRIAKALGAKEFKLKTDSKLVVGQTTNEYEGERGKNAKELKTNSTVSWLLLQCQDWTDPKGKQLRSWKNCLG